MASFFRSAWLILVTHLKRMALSRRMLFMAAFACLPMGAGFLASVLAPPDRLERALAIIAWHLLLMLVLPVAALISGSSVVSEELSDRTLTYVFSRPVSRAGFFVGRLVASLLCVCPLVGIAAWGTFVWSARVGAELSAQVVPVVLLGGVTYTILFAAISAVVRRAMVVGVAYTMVMEVLIANLPGKTARLSIQHHLRSMLVDEGGVWQGSLARLVPASFETSLEAIENLAWIAVIALVVGILVVRKKQYLVAS